MVDIKKLNIEVNKLDKDLNSIILELESEIESICHQHYSLEAQISSMGLVTIQSDLLKLNNNIDNLKNKINE
tara:strand:+ start:262 stop:477 length:216 start_codon:yes stop_codon:yes gene_type:complete